MATSSVSGVFNRNHVRIFQWWGRLNRNIQLLDSDNDGMIDQDIIDENIVIDPETGLDEEFGLPLDEAILAKYPNLQRAKDALVPLNPFLEDPRLIEAFNLRFLPDGDVNQQWAGAITDTQDITSKGFEAEIILNPTPSWRIAFNAAQQKVILDNIAPRLGVLINEVWVPYLAEFGDLDWGNPVEAPDGATIQDQVGGRLIEYFAVKGQEGKPTAEQRDWRFNFITNYSFREGRLKGFSIGGSARWQDEAAGGYPITVDSTTGLVLPVVTSPFFTDTDLAIDLTFGYRRKIFDKIDWRLQINLRNVNNWNSSDVDIIRFQPDGSDARARFAPPRQVLLTNTFRF